MKWKKVGENVKRTSFLHCIMLSLLLVSCSSDRMQNYTVKEENHTDMIYLTMFGNKTDAVNTQAIEEILHDFMDEYPDINISYEKRERGRIFSHS